MLKRKVSTPFIYIILFCAVFGLVGLSARGVDLEKNNLFPLLQEHAEKKAQETKTETQADQTHGSTEAGEHGEEHGDSGLLAKLINFLVLFGGLGVLLRKPIANYLKDRGEGIQKDLDDAVSSRKSSESELTKMNARLNEIAQEVEGIKKEAEKRGKEEKSHILAAAEADGKRLKAQTKQDIELLSQFGARELKIFAVEKASEKARERIKSRIKPENQPALIDKSIERLETLYEKSGSA